MMKRKLKGTFIRTTNYKIDGFVNYQIIWDVYNGCYRLLCLDTANIMATKNGFRNETEIRDYIAKKLEMKIVTWSTNNL